MMRIRLWHLICLVMVLPFLSACAPASGMHGFEYYPKYKEYELLDYEYYNHLNGGIRPKAEMVRRGQSVGVLNTFGPMYFGEYFYVKWQDKKTGVVYERRIDVRSRYLDDMENTSFTFEFDRAELRVFLVKHFVESIREKYARINKKNAKPFVNRIVYQIYPDKSRGKVEDENQ